MAKITRQNSFFTEVFQKQKSAFDNAKIDLPIFFKRKKIMQLLTFLEVDSFLLMYLGFSSAVESTFPDISLFAGYLSNCLALKLQNAYILHTCKSRRKKI